MASEAGARNVATVPKPLTLPSVVPSDAPPPATVVTAYVPRFSMRMTLFPVSET